MAVPKQIHPAFYVAGLKTCDTDMLKMQSDAVGYMWELVHERRGWFCRGSSIRCQDPV